MIRLLLIPPIWSNKSDNTDDTENVANNRNTTLKYRDCNSDNQNSKDDTFLTARDKIISKNVEAKTSS